MSARDDLLRLPVLLDLGEDNPVRAAHRDTPRYFDLLPSAMRCASGGRARLPGGVTNTVDNLVSSAGSLASDLSNNEVNNLLNNATATATGLVNQVEGIATYLL